MEDTGTRSLGVTLPKKGSVKSVLLPHRNPDLEAAETGFRVESLIIALEPRRIRRYIARLRQPAVPDGVHRCPNGRDMALMRELRIEMFGDAQAAGLMAILTKHQRAPIGASLARHLIEIAAWFIFSARNANVSSCGARQEPFGKGE